MDDDKPFTDVGATGDQPHGRLQLEHTPPPPYTEHDAYPHGPSSKGGAGNEDLGPPPPYSPPSGRTQSRAVTTQPQRMVQQNQARAQQRTSVAPAQSDCCSTADDGCTLCICCFACGGCDCDGCDGCGDCSFDL